MPLYRTRSSSAEEYLLALYRFERDGVKTGTCKLADLFGVKAPSVTGMLRRLHDRGWVNYRRYRPPQLTPIGRSMAARLIRRHRLLETFLVECLDFAPEDVHKEVQSLEHSASDNLILKISQKLGNPQFDPHGEPIPQPEESLLDRSSRYPKRYSID